MKPSVVDLSKETIFGRNTHCETSKGPGVICTKKCIQQEGCNASLFRGSAADCLTSDVAAARKPRSSKDKDVTLKLAFLDFKESHCRGRRPPRRGWEPCPGDGSRALAMGARRAACPAPRCLRGQGRAEAETPPPLQLCPSPGTRISLLGPGGQRRAASPRRPAPSPAAASGLTQGFAG